jgi:hypothetical protein
MDTNKTTLAAAMLVGYAAGRTKKGKLLLGLLTVAAGRGMDPVAVIGQGVGKLTENPAVAELSEQIRGELLGAGRAALSATTSRGVSSLTDALEQRTDSLLGNDEEAEGDEGDDTSEEDATGEVEDDAYEDEEGDQQEEEPDEEEEPEEQEAPEPARPSRRRAVKRAEKPTDRKPGPKNPPAKKAMARKAADRKAAEKKAAGRRSSRRSSWPGT